jgi:hypothetical protein
LLVLIVQPFQRHGEGGSGFEVFRGEADAADLHGVETVGGLLAAA